MFSYHSQEIIETVPSFMSLTWPLAKHALISDAIFVTFAIFCTTDSGQPAKQRLTNVYVCNQTLPTNSKPFVNVQTSVCVTRVVDERPIFASSWVITVLQLNPPTFLLVQLLPVSLTLIETTSLLISLSLAVATSAWELSNTDKETFAVKAHSTSGNIHTKTYAIYLSEVAISDGDNTSTSH